MDYQEIPDQKYELTVEHSRGTYKMVVCRTNPHGLFIVKSCNGIPTIPKELKNLYTDLASIKKDLHKYVSYHKGTVFEEQTETTPAKPKVVPSEKTTRNKPSSAIGDSK